MKPGDILEIHAFFGDVPELSLYGPPKSDSELGHEIARIPLPAHVTVLAAYEIPYVREQSSTVLLLSTHIAVGYFWLSNLKDSYRTTVIK